MGKIVLGMTMSLDGFINDRHGSVGRLYSDFKDLHDTSVLKDAVKNTGAVVMGKHAFEMADDPDSYADTYEFQVPIFVLTHKPPAKHPKENETLKFIFVTDGIESAVTQAKAAARGKDVQIIGGANTFQQCLNKGLCDELHIDIMPVLLGAGLKLFEHIDNDKIRLKKSKVITSTPERTSIVFKVKAGKSLMFNYSNKE